MKKVVSSFFIKLFMYLVFLGLSSYAFGLEVGAFEDSWVNKLEPNRNFGSSVWLALRDEDAYDAKYAYMKFDLSSLADDFYSAELVLHYWNNYGTNVLEARAICENWDEMQVTWNNRVELGPVIDSTSVTGYEGTVVLDVTSHVVAKGAGIIEIALAIPKYYWLNVCSREYYDPDFRPKLYINQGKPYEDSWVNKKTTDRNRNFGTTSYLALRNEIKRDAKYAYLKFNIPQYTHIYYAELVLDYYNNNITNTLQVNPVISSWEEMNVTWNTKPVIDTTIASRQVSGFQGTVIFDLTSYIDSLGPGILDIALSMPDGGWMNVRSREYPVKSLQPTLNICRYDKILSHDGYSDQCFGEAVSVSCPFAVAGTALDDTKGQNAGAVYVYKWDGTAWNQKVKLMAADGGTGAFFGRAVDIDNDIIVVSAPGAGLTGAVYVFMRDGNGDWYQEAKLQDPGSSQMGCGVAVHNNMIVAVDLDGMITVFKRAGSSWVNTAHLHPLKDVDLHQPVAIGDNRIIIGAPKDDDKGMNAGAAYVYRFNGYTWESEKIYASDANRNRYFGASVSYSDDRALIGAPTNGIAGAGAAYVFTVGGTSSTQKDNLTAGDGVTGDHFGIAVSISGDQAIIGAESDDQFRGSGYLYTLNSDGRTWGETVKLIPPDGSNLDYFGCSVHLNDDIAIIGASGDDDNGNHSGSAYVFDFPIQ